MARHKEGKIESYFTQQVEAHGGVQRKAKWLDRRGCPDRFWAFPETARNGFAEVKAPGERLDAHQEREIERLEKARVRVYVLDTYEAVDAFIKREAF